MIEVNVVITCERCGDSESYTGFDDTWERDARRDGWELEGQICRACIDEEDDLDELADLDGHPDPAHALMPAPAMRCGTTMVTAHPASQLKTCHDRNQFQHHCPECVRVGIY